MVPRPRRSTSPATSSTRCRTSRRSRKSSSPLPSFLYVSPRSHFCRLLPSSPWPYGTLLLPSSFPPSSHALHSSSHSQLYSSSMTLNCSYSSKSNSSLIRPIPATPFHRRSLASSRQQRTALHHRDTNPTLNRVLLRRFNALSAAPFEGSRSLC
jgi:hypothetical protein